jgi:hypothetical protein
MKTKDQYLQIRVAPAEKAAIQAAAVRAGMDMSGWVLERLLPPGAKQFQALVKALGCDAERRRYGLAELNDFLSSLGPRALAQATAEPPAMALDAYVANYVAAMVETAAHRAEVPAPRWTADITSLAEPFFATPLVGLRMYLLLNSPPAFRRRNIFIDATIGARV